MKFRRGILLACAASVLALAGCDAVPSESPVEGAGVAAGFQPAPATLMSLALDSVVAVASRDVVASGGEAIQRVNVALAEYKKNFERFRGTHPGLQGKGQQWLPPAEVRAAVEQSLAGTRLTEVTLSCEGKRRCTLEHGVLIVRPGPTEEFPNGAFLLHFQATRALRIGESHSEPYPVWVAPDEDGIYRVAGVGRAAAVAAVEAMERNR